MSLFRDLGQAFQLLSQYNCSEALEQLTKLPPRHHDTAWVLGLTGRAHFETGEYASAVRAFSEAKERDPHCPEMAEYHSTALWHLQREVQLSALAQDLIQMDPETPQAWCAVGNCFSLQKEHEAAIRFFSRAIQVCLIIFFLQVIFVF